MGEPISGAERTPPPRRALADMDIDLWVRSKGQNTSNPSLRRLPAFVLVRSHLEISMTRALFMAATFFLVAIPDTLLLADAEKIWNFDADPPDTLPTDFTVGTLFDGRPAGDWKVQPTDKAKSPSHVLAQLRLYPQSAGTTPPAPHHGVSVSAFAESRIW